MADVFIAGIGDGPLEEKIRFYLDMEAGWQKLSFVPWNDTTGEAEVNQIVGSCVGAFVDFGPEAQGAGAQTRGSYQLTFWSNDARPGGTGPMIETDLNLLKVEPGTRIAFPAITLDNRVEATAWTYSLGWSRNGG